MGLKAYLGDDGHVGVAASRHLRHADAQRGIGAHELVVADIAIDKDVGMAFLTNVVKLPRDGRAPVLELKVLGLPPLRTLVGQRLLHVPGNVDALNVAKLCLHVPRADLVAVDVLGPVPESAGAPELQPGAPHGPLYSLHAAGGRDVPAYETLGLAGASLGFRRVIRLVVVRFRPCHAHVCDPVVRHGRHRKTCQDGKG